MDFSENYNVEVVDFNDSEPEMLAKALERLRLHQHVDSARIICNKRDTSGWIEYLLIIKYNSGGMTIGCIQREPGAEYEFHS